MKKNYLIFIAFIIIIALGAIYFKENRPLVQNTTPNNQETGSGPVLCTEDALMCPDGSFVGRDSSKKCVFNQCPYSGPYIGKLSKQGDEFFLITNSPTQAKTQEITYSMPLKVNSDVNALLGKNVSVSGTFNEGNILTVSNIQESEQNNVRVKIGETAFINGITITLNKLISDSRCPSDVQCITAGFASFEVSLKSDTDKETVTLSSMSSTHPFDTTKISIIKVEPAPLSTKNIKSTDYVVTFKVENL